MLLGWENLKDTDNFFDEIGVCFDNVKILFHVIYFCFFFDTDTFFLDQRRQTRD